MGTDRALFWAKRLGLFGLARWLTRGRLRILCYHGVWIGPAPHYGDCLFVSAGMFERRMAMLAEQGYRVLSLSQAVELLAARQVGMRDVVITIDDAWQGTERHMLPVLEKHRFPATLYVPTSNVVSGEPVLPVLVVYLVTEATRRGRHDKLAGLLPSLPAERELELADRLEAWLLGFPGWPERLAALRAVGQALGLDIDTLLASGAFSLMNPAALQRAAQSGVDVQLHTHHHTMHGMDAAGVRQEIELNRTTLATLLECDPASLRHLCYPSGEHDRSVFDVLRRCNVQTATTTEFGLAGSDDAQWALPRILDGELLSEIQLEARLSGFWSLAKGLRGLMSRRAAGAGP
jgi:peptidoglycan/xylan/chitin deacetylase (PgdA/CDA1 family)